MAEFDRYMGDSDAIMWTIERDPLLRSTIVVLFLYDRTPEFDRVVHRVERTSRLIPRMRQRVVPMPFNVSPPRWVYDARFDVRDHLHHFAAPAPHDVGSVLELAAIFAETEFDRERPLWELAIVDGLEGGRAGALLKVHHSVTDGIGGIRLLSLLTDTERTPTTPLPYVPPPRPERSFPPLLALEGVGHTANQLTRAATTVARNSLRGIGHLLRHPLQTARETVELADSLERVLTPITDTLSPVMQARSDRRRCAVLEYPLDDLREAAHAASGTVNDAFVAAVAGGLSRYHDEHGIHVHELRMTMPISTRGDDDTLGGNRLMPARFPLPVDVEDPAERVLRIADVCHAWQHEPALPVTDAIAAVLDHLPGPVTARIFGGMLKHIDFLATNIPGSAVPLYFCGARIDRMWALAPPMGAAVNVSLVSHAGTACIGIVVDPVAIPDTDAFVACVAAGFDEVLALARATAPAPLEIVPRAVNEE